MASTIKITGLGAVCASGGNVEQCLQNMYAGIRNPSPPSLFEADLKVQYPVFEYKGRLPEESNTMVTRSVRLLLKALHEALNQAQLTESDLSSGYRVGVCIGTTVACTLNNEQFYRAWKDNKTPGFEAIERYLSNNPALFIRKRYNLKGPAATVANACSSGTDAIGISMHWLSQDLCDIVIAGGTDELCRTTYLGFASLLVTSDEPCRPFDARRKGLNLGEGAGVLVLERDSAANNRKAKALAYAAGYGTAADAFHCSSPHPDGTGLKKAITFALSQSTLNIRDISFINSHGTSTEANDCAEGAIISRLFSTEIPVTSTKSYTGHTLGAAGALEAVFSVKSLCDGMIPATLGFEHYDEKCMLSPTIKTTAVKTSAALSTSLAFGGTNSALLLTGTEQ
ncbi:MAG: beta-ketoacyl-[acyl-carrier-protein] synthase family protein [Nitrospirae bacterium YQR-1]